VWLGSVNCKLCMITSRVGDLARLQRPDKFPEILAELSKLVGCSSRSEAFSKSFEAVRRLVGVRDPYSAYKERLAAIGRRVAGSIRRRLEQLSWDLRTALRVAAAANIVDTSVLGYRPKKLEDAIWDLPAIEERVELPPRVYYVLDNMGEAQIDLVVMEALERSGIKPVIVVRSEPYEIDATRDDLGTYSVIETPGNSPPVMWLEDGFILAKGIANFEAYVESGRAPALLLLRAKCDVISALFSVPKNAPLVMSGSTAKAFARLAAF